MGYGWRRGGHRAVLSPGVVREVEGDHAVGRTPRVVAGNVEFRAGKRDDVLRYYARVKLREKAQSVE